MVGSLIVLGAGGHAKVVIDAAQRAGFRTAALLDDDPAKRGTEFFGVRVHGGCADWRTLAGDRRFIVAIGSNALRARLQQDLEANQREMAVIRHPFTAVAPSVRLGAGSVLLAGSVVNADTEVGRGVIVNTGATVDHDCLIEDWVHVAPGVSVCGGVRVGAGTLLGVGARVLPGVKIGCRCVVGAGAVVHRDVPDDVRVVGVPARRFGESR